MIIELFDTTTIIRLLHRLHGQENYKKKLDPTEALKENVNVDYTPCIYTLIFVIPPN